MRSLSVSLAAAILLQACSTPPPAEPGPPATSLRAQEETLRSQLVAPPDGFVWQVYRNCAFLKPPTWNGRSREGYAQNGHGRTPIGVYAISPESFSEEKQFEMGFTVQIFINPEKHSHVVAENTALLLLDSLIKAHTRQDILMLERSQRGDEHITIFRYRDAPPGLKPIIVHKFIIANDVADTVHVFTFESPEASWSENWKAFGTPILSKVAVFPVPAS